MFDISFSQLVVVFFIGLLVLGPKKLPIAIKTVVGWIKVLRALSAYVQLELSKELKLQELQERLCKTEESGRQKMTPEITTLTDELKQVMPLIQENCQKKANCVAYDSNKPKVGN